MVYSGTELNELQLAWATTVHKSQGSECPVVVLAIAPNHRPLLTRRLLYTGLHLCQPDDTIAAALFLVCNCYSKKRAFYTQHNIIDSFHALVALSALSCASCLFK